MQGNEVLLGMRKRDPRKGTWSGYGGKVEQGESPLDAVKREVAEEAGIAILDVNQIGTLTFASPKYPSDHVMHLFQALSFTGQLTETDEMAPQWFHVHKIPYEQMSVTDAHWMPPLLEGKQITGHFSMNEAYEIETFDLRET